MSGVGTRCTDDKGRVGRDIRRLVRGKPVFRIPKTQTCRFIGLWPKWGGLWKPKTKVVIKSVSEGLYFPTKWFRGTVDKKRQINIKRKRVDGVSSVGSSSVVSTNIHVTQSVTYVRQTDDRFLGINDFRKMLKDKGRFGGVVLKRKLKATALHYLTTVQPYYVGNGQLIFLRISETSFIDPYYFLKKRELLRLIKLSQ